jgi:hypothetical protein
MPRRRKVKSGVAMDKVKVIIISVVVICAISAVGVYILVSPNVLISSGEEWTSTWRTTEQIINPTTGAITSSSNYIEMSRYLENQTKNGYECLVLKIARDDKPNEYSLNYYHIENESLYDVAMETWYNGVKNGETIFAEPLFSRNMTFSIGMKNSDEKPVFMYNDNLGLNSFDGQMSYQFEVLGEETVTVNAGTFSTYFIQQNASIVGTGTFTNLGQTATCGLIITENDNIWYSDNLGTTIKYIGDSSMTITSLGQTITYEQHLERRLLSYR